MQRAEVILVVENARLGWILSREQRRARRVTEWILAVGAIEPHALGSKLVEIWCLDDIVAVAAERGTQIIGDQEEYIVLRLLRGNDWQAPIVVRHPGHESEDADKSDDSDSFHDLK